MTNYELFWLTVFIIIALFALRRMHSPISRSKDGTLGNLLYLKVTEAERERDQFRADCVKMERTLITYEKHIDELLIELQFYANEDIYREDWSNGSPILKDKGQRARRVVDKYTISGEETLEEAFTGGL